MDMTHSCSQYRETTRHEKSCNAEYPKTDVWWSGHFVGSSDCTCLYIVTDANVMYAKQKHKKPMTPVWFKINCEMFQHTLIKLQYVYFYQSISFLIVCGWPVLFDSQKPYKGPDRVFLYYVNKPEIINVILYHGMWTTLDPLIWSR